MLELLLASVVRVPVEDRRPHVRVDLALGDVARRLEQKERGHPRLSRHRIEDRRRALEESEPAVLPAEHVQEALVELGLQSRELIHPVRVALTGKTIGPGLFEVIYYLGKERVSRRLMAWVKQL